VSAAGVDGLYNVADDLPILRRLVRLLATCGGGSSNRSTRGPRMLAAAVDCPLVVLFGPKASDGPLYRPWGRGGADVKVLTGQVAGRAQHARHRNAGP